MGFSGGAGGGGGGSSIVGVVKANIPAINLNNSYEAPSIEGATRITFKLAIKDTNGTINGSHGIFLDGEINGIRMTAFITAGWYSGRVLALEGELEGNAFRIQNGGRGQMLATQLYVVGWA